MNKQGCRNAELCNTLAKDESDDYLSCAHNYEESLSFSSTGAFPGVTFLHPLNSSVYLHGKDLDDEDLSYPLASFADPDIIEYFQKQGFKEAFQDPLKVRKVNFYLILERVLSSEKPVLFHCSSGRHRTGMIALALRTIQGGEWTKILDVPLFPKQAKQESESIELKSLAEIEYYFYNSNGFRKSNIESIRKLSQEKRFIDLIDTYRVTLSQ